MQYISDFAVLQCKHMLLTLFCAVWPYGNNSLSCFSEKTITCGIVFKKASKVFLRHVIRFSWGSTHAQELLLLPY